MSFTLTYKDISKPAFLTGMRKLIRSDKFKDPKHAYNIARIGTLLDSELKTFQDLHSKLMKKIRDAKPENDAEPTDTDKATLEALKAEDDRFNEVSFTLERHKIDFGDLTDIGLTPGEIMALEPLLDNLPA